MWFDVVCLAAQLEEAVCSACFCSASPLRHLLSSTTASSPTTESDQDGNTSGTTQSAVRMTGKYDVLFQRPCAAALLLSALSYCTCSSSKNVMNLSNAEDIKKKTFITTFQ